MLSPADLALAGAAALILFGPDKLPGLARQIGKVTREIQSTGQSFIREIERSGEETFEEREARRIRENAMHPQPAPDYAATIASRPPKETEPVYDPVAVEPSSTGGVPLGGATHGDAVVHGDDVAAGMSVDSWQPKPEMRSLRARPSDDDLRD